MNTCNTCKYWEAEDRRWVSEAWKAVRECTYALEFWKCRDWNDDGVDVLTSDRKAFVQDGSDYAAGLYTRPDFGCNQWEAK